MIRRLRCPACSSDLDKQGHCRACGGQWLANGSARERVPLVLTGGGYGERHCPVCDETMDEPLIFDIPVDRCEAHGLWFDKAELDEVVARSKTDGWKSSPKARPADSLRMLIAAVGAWKR